MKEKVKRLAPKKDTLIRLFAKSNNQCTFPGCRHKLIDEDNDFVAQVCHIEAANKGGERFNSKSSNEERRSYDNLILLCYEHHIKTNDTKRYTVGLLKKIKSEHEAQSSESYKLDEALLGKIYNQQLKLIQSIKKDTESILDDTGSIKDQIIELSKQINEVAPLSTKSSSKTIDTILEIGIEKQPQVVLDQLKRFKKNSSRLNELENYRIEANCGLCYLNIFKYSQATHCFERALAYQPENSKALALASLGSWLSGSKKRAKELSKKAIKIDGLNINAWIVNLRLYSKKISFKKLKKLVPRELIQTREILYVLGFCAKERGLFQEAINLFQKAIDSSKKDESYDIKATLATTIIESISDPFLIFSNQVSSDIKLKLNYAMDLLSEAWEAIKQTELRESRSWWLTNRGIANKLKGQFEMAIDDFKLVFDINERDDYNTYQIILTYILLENFDQASNFLDKIDPKGLSNAGYNYDLLRLEIGFKLDQYEETIIGIKRLLSSESDLDIKLLIEANQILAVAYIKKGNSDEAINICEKLIEDHPNELGVYLITTMVHICLKQDDRAHELVKLGFESVHAQSDKIDLLQLAKYLDQFREYKRAVEIYSKIHDPTVYSDITEKLVIAYYKAEDYKPALKLCERIYLNYGPIPALVEYQVTIYEAIDNIPNAIDLCKNYLVIYPDDDKIKVRLCFIYSRIGEGASALELINQVRNIDQLPLEVQFRVAHLYLLNKEYLKGTELAYKIRSTNYANGIAHSNFMNLMFSFESPSTLEKPEKVELDCAVIVRREDDKELVYTIVNSFDKPSGTELSINSEVAQLLLNKSVGDIIQLRNKSGKLKITHILNKYTHALRESMELLSTKYVENQNFESLNIGTTGIIEHDFAPMFERINEADKYDKQLHDLYTRNKLTAGCLAELKDRTVTQTWAYLVSDRKTPIFSFRDQLEYDNALLKFNDEKPNIILDISSAITINLIKGWNILKQCTSEIFISQSVLDDIRAHIQEYKTMGTRGLGTIVKSGETYVMHQYSVEDIEELVANYAALVSKLGLFCKTKPINEALNMSAEDRFSRQEVLGKVCFDSILLAREHDLLYCAEENVVRSIAHSEYEINGISIPMILQVAIQKNVLDKQGYDTMMARLIEFNYQGIPINEDILMLCFERASYQIKYPLNQALSCFRSHTEVGIACRMAVSFLYGVFVHGCTQETKINMTFEVLRNLLDNRNPRETFKLIGLHVNFKFKLVPLHKKEIITIISDFIKASYSHLFSQS